MLLEGVTRGGNEFTWWKLVDTSAQVSSSQVELTTGKVPRSLNLREGERWGNKVTKIM